MKKAFVILLAVLPLMAACVETFSPSVRITPSLNYVPYTGGSVDVTIMTDLPWKVVLDDDCPATVSKTNGIGDDVITVTVPPTDSWTTSCITLKIYARSNSATATKTEYITQGYKPYISVEGEAGTIAADGGQVRLVVVANGEWTSSCTTAGVTVTPAADQLGNHAVLISIPANTTGATRKITVNFAIDGDSTSFDIYQAG